jgi:hypothetical protein
MPKKIDWDTIRLDFIESNLPYAALAEQHGVSRQSVEKRGSDEAWQALRQAFRQEQSIAVQTEHSNQKFDLDELLKKAIALSFQQLEVSEAKSFEGASESVCKVAEVYLKIHPPRPPSVADWVNKALDFGHDIPELMRQIKERSFEIG